MTKTAEVADVLLPATSWGEHGGVFTCADRGFQRFGKAIEASGNVKRDWEIISLLATKWAIRCTTPQTSRSGMRCARCVRCSTA